LVAEGGGGILRENKSCDTKRKALTLDVERFKRKITNNLYGPSSVERLLRGTKP